MATTDEFDLTISDETEPPVPGRRKNNFTATVAPTATDDSTLDFERGSRWLNTVTGIEYTCRDATASAAVWRATGVGLPASLTFEYGPNAAVNDYHLIPVPFDFTVQGWRIMGDVSGSVSIDAWIDVFSNGQPTNADSVTASATPSVTTAISNSSTTLTGWDTTWTRGDMLKVVIESLTTMQQVTIEFYGIRTS